jgi:hypothetical protein
MVGTGRIELPTSSVSRKRSPTELRACTSRQDSPAKAAMLNIKLISMIGLMPDPTWQNFSRSGSAMQEFDFITNFSD